MSPEVAATLPPLPTDPAKLQELARIGQLTLQHLEEREAAERAAKQPHKPAPPPKRGDVQAAASRIGQVVLTLVAVHRVAWRAMMDDEGDREAALTLITETVRGAVRALGACGQKLGDTTAGGHFSDDMEDGPR